MQFARTSLAVAVSLTLSGCVGGGGGGGLSATLGGVGGSTSVPFHTPARINSFQPHYAPHEYRTPLTEIYTQDLNRDGSDEVLWSNVAFDASGQDWIQSQVQVFGFNTGNFTNETNAWFRPGDNVYTGGFRINFGDFDGSGLTDVFLATFTDTANHSGPSVMLENTVSAPGQVNYFSRRLIDFGVNLHSHDSIVADFNSDGIVDVLKTGSGMMLGSATGNYQTLVTDTAIGSGLSAADYLGDGTLTVVMTDGPGQGDPDSDTLLFRPRIENGQLFMDQVAVLPADRFFLPKWTGLVDRSSSPHAVRSVTMDFDRNGRPDVVIFSTMGRDNNTHGWTEVQFLRNDGAGQFVDVTDSVLAAFDHGKSVSYNPMIMDVNNDGLPDIFMSATDYTGQSSTSVLIATTEGKFVESYIPVFDAFASQIKSTTANAGQNQPIAIVAGPNNTRYLVSGVAYEADGIAKVAVYASLIGSAGTPSAAATVASLRQTWPWLNPVDANTVLAETTTQWLDGVPVIDQERIWWPVGDLTIDINGQLRLLHGHVNIPGLNPALLSGLRARDRIGRDFTVNLSVLEKPTHMIKADHVISAMNPQQVWSARLVGESQVSSQGLSLAGQSVERFSASVSTLDSGLTDQWDITLGLGRMPGSPWLSFSGVFGSVEYSTMTDVTVSRDWSDGWFVQGDMMRTVTRFTPGLIQHVSPLWSVSAMAGWRDQKWAWFAGIQPTIVHGRVGLDLPVDVDLQGKMQYTRYTADVRSTAIMFAGTQFHWNHKTHHLTWSAAMNQTGSYRTQLAYRKDF